MIIEKGNQRNVIVRYRDNNDKRVVLTDRDHWPYCYVKSTDAHMVNAVRKQAGYKGILGEDLVKIVVADSFDLKDIRNLGIPTWEANIPFTNRVMVDRVQEGKERIPNYNHRVWYMDCEWNPKTNAMRIIVFYDSYTEKEYVYFVDQTLQKAQSFDKVGDYEYDNLAWGFPTEKEMLDKFLTIINEQDPDVITGWYVTGADIKTIIERCNKVGLRPSRLSPMNKIRYQFGDWAQPILGRNCIDLMIGFSKLWELKNGKLPSYKLDDVSSEVLGEKKIELPDGHNTYLTDLPLYLHYARQDVRLLPKLDSKVNAIEYYLALQHLVQCDIRSTPFITKMFTNLALMDDNFPMKIPTSPQFAKVDYEGANVMEVESGLYKNVGILDVKAMYHSNASLYNISWDTLDKDGQDCGNGTKFNLESKGLLVNQMDYMTKLRNKFKALVKSDPSNYDKWDTMQFACKSLVASMYGVAGDAKYGLYNPEVASAITYTSRQTLDKLKEEVESFGFKVIYGHTDSVFVLIPSPQEGMDALREINISMSPIETEFEKWCSSMILMAKNRYAGNVAWTEGKYHDHKLYVKGIEMKQSRMPQVMKQCMEDVIGGILSADGEKIITDKLSNVILKVINKEADPNDLCMKGKLDRNLSDYKVLSGPSAGAAWANEYLGKGYKSGSYFKVTIDNNGKYIAFDDPSDIEGLYDIGYTNLVERFIIKKVQPYYEMMKWDMQPLDNALRGINNLNWL